MGFSFFSIFKYPIIYFVCPTFFVSDSDLNSPRNNKESGAEMRPKIVSDIVTGVLEIIASLWRENPSRDLKTELFVRTV